MERIQKRIAQSGVTSRRKAEDLIVDGRVKVNGIVVKTPGFKVNPKDEIAVDDIIIENAQKQYYVMNKPRNIVSTVSDEFNRKTVIDLLPHDLKKERLFPVGRLDYDTKGILLITNDGEFMNQMVGPKSGIQKEYLVRIRGVISSESIKKLEKGVEINKKTTLPAIIELESIDRTNNSSLVRIIITEGMYHQVKEMFKVVGHEVKKMTRIRFGSISIGDLSEGDIRPLTIHEIKTLYELSKKSKVLKKENIHKYRQY